MKRRCIICRVNVLRDGYICPYCKDKIYPVKGPVCRFCGIDLISERGTCLRCRDSERPETANVSLYHYRGMVPFLISELKNGKSRAAAIFFAGECAAVIKAGFHDYLVVPVPCRPENKKKRGYDQLMLLSGLLEKKYGIAVLQCLGRKRGAKSQKLLNREERKRNIKGKIVLRGRIPASSEILLLDDVYTTGSTLSECALVLKDNGVSEIRSLTIARD